MSREDWFRHSTWSAADKNDFFSRLKRSRSKSQYLRIQASHLADAGFHAAAIELIDVLIGQHAEASQLSQAYLQKALALVELRNRLAAIKEFRSSLQAQREFPNVRTRCWLEFPWFIVRHRLTELYDEALRVLEEFKSDATLTFPIDRYEYAAVRAIIAAGRGETDQARDFAKIALQTETLRHSGFRYHSNVGLVELVDAEIHRQLAEIVRTDSSDSNWA